MARVWVSRWPARRSGFLLMLPLHLCGAMGGGDVKLMAAFGTLLGPAGILAAAVFGAIAGAIWALGCKAARRYAQFPTRRRSPPVCGSVS